MVQGLLGLLLFSSFGFFRRGLRTPCFPQQKHLTESDATDLEPLELGTSDDATHEAASELPLTNSTSSRTSSTKNAGCPTEKPSIAVVVYGNTRTWATDPRVYNGLNTFLNHLSTRYRVGVILHGGGRNIPPHYFPTRRIEEQRAMAAKVPFLKRWDIANSTGTSVTNISEVAPHFRRGGCMGHRFWGQFGGGPPSGRLERSLNTFLHVQEAMQMLVEHEKEDVPCGIRYDAVLLTRFDIYMGKLKIGQSDILDTVERVRSNRTVIRSKDLAFLFPRHVGDM